MYQYPIIGNHFQTHMRAKFDLDVTSALANMSNVRGREDLVYEYIRDIASLFQPVRYGLQDNPMGLYSDYESFKKHFVRYWRNALDISRADSDKISEMFDDELTTQESCKNRVVTAVFFENGKALTIEDCLYAIYEVLRIA